MTTSTINFGWNGISDAQKAAKENERMIKRINRVFSKVGQPTVSNIGGSSLEVLYEVGSNHKISYIVTELRECKNLGYSINKTISRLVDELK